MASPEINAFILALPAFYQRKILSSKDVFAVDAGYRWENGKRVENEFCFRLHYAGNDEFMEMYDVAEKFLGIERYASCHLSGSMGGAPSRQRNLDIANLRPGSLISNVLQGLLACLSWRVKPKNYL